MPDAFFDIYEAQAPHKPRIPERPAAGPVSGIRGRRAWSPQPFIDNAFSFVPLVGSLPPGHPTSPQQLRGTDCRLPVSLAHLSSLRRVRDSPFGSSGDRGPEQLGGSPGPGASGHCLPSSARCPGALGWLCYAWKTIIRLEKNSPKCPESSLSAALLVAFISLLLFHIFHTFPCNGHSSESRRGPPNTGKLGTGSVYLLWSERASQRARNKRTAGPDPRGGERPAARAGATRFAAEDSAAWLKPAVPAGPPEAPGERCPAVPEPARSDAVLAA